MKDKMGLLESSRAGGKIVAGNKIAKLKAACLTASFVATVAATPVNADPLGYDLTLTPNTTLNNVTFLFGLGACFPHGYAVPLAAIVNANSTAHFQGQFDISWQGYGPDDPNQPTGFYTVMATYQKAGGGEGVAVMYTSAIASALLGMTGTDTSWQGSNLPGFDGSSFQAAPVGYTESQVIAALDSQDLPTLVNLAGWYSEAGGFTQVIGPRPGDAQAVTLLDFSNPTDGGSGSAQAIRVVPEPASGALLALASAMFVGYRRFRDKKQ
ncbi:MAG: PEP-CTERM sorting domain-containing protein [Verrucomicrobiae bacterium]|nr:PEP-CTERM sorting domain-containing protein [Verrucomicrobiae bacterium]